MPNISKNFLESIKDSYTDYPNFIETGTYEGSTIFAFEPLFKQLYTIELSEKLYKIAKGRYRGDKITFIHGDSSVKLIELLPNIQGKSIFFLDGHWSCGKTAQGEKDVPLYEELKAIMELHQDSCVIIIDDARLFQTKNKCDWSDINKETILEITQERTKSFHFLPSKLAAEDRFVLYLESK